MLSEKRIKWLVRICIIMPLILVFYFVYKYGITVPYGDEWEFVPLLEKLHNHTLTFGDLWRQHNEHRILFSKVIIFLLASISGWNIFLELCINIGFACMGIFFLFAIVNDTQGTKNNNVLKMFISLFIFSMVQYKNWQWGWQMAIWISVFGVILSIWSINKWQGKLQGMFVSISGAILASYSFGAGLLVWPTVFFMLLFQKRWKMKHKLIWIAAGFVTVALYYYKLEETSLKISKSYFLVHPVEYVEYVLRYLGSPLGRSITFAIVIALVLFVIGVFALLDIRRLDEERFEKMIPWLAFCVFAILSACLTGIVRVVGNPGRAIASRYTTISILFVISVIVLLYNSIELNYQKNGKLDTNHRCN